MTEAIESPARYADSIGVELGTLRRLKSWLHGLTASAKHHLYGDAAMARRFNVEVAHVYDGKLTLASAANIADASEAVFEIEKIVEAYFFPSKVNPKDLDVVFATRNNMGGLVSRYAGTINLEANLNEVHVTMLGCLSQQTNLGDIPKDLLDKLRLLYSVKRAKELGLLDSADNG